MRFSWFHRMINHLKGSKNVFIVKSSDCDNTTEIVQVVNSESNTKVDVFNDCQDLFMTLNRHKDYYQVGVINKNDKRNTSKILEKLVATINPRIKIVTYTDKNNLKKQLSIA